jgi:hypothetical protein
VPRECTQRSRRDAETKKAAEVDFTWAAFAGTYEKRVLAIASQVDWIDVVIAAKPSFAPTPRRKRRGALHEAQLLANDQHDHVTLSAPSFTVKVIFSKSRKCACGFLFANQGR